MGFGNTRAGFAFDLVYFKEAVLAAKFPEVFSDVQPRMAFSTRAVSAILAICAPACSIHSKLRLCGSIMVLRVYTVKEMLDLFFAVTAPRITD